MPTVTRYAAELVLSVARVEIAPYTDEQQLGEVGGWTAAGCADV